VEKMMGRWALPLIVLIGLGCGGLVEIAAEEAADQISDQVAERGTEWAMEAASGGDVNLEEGTFEIKTDDGNVKIQAGGQGEVPKDLPFSLPADTPVEGTMHMANDTELIDAFVFPITEPPETLMDRVEEELKAKGYETARVRMTDGGEAAWIITAKKDREELVFGVGKDQKELRAVVTWTRKLPQ